MPHKLVVLYKPMGRFYSSIKTAPLTFPIHITNLVAVRDIKYRKVLSVHVSITSENFLCCNSLGPVENLVFMPP